jgi:hypothetical protein
MALAPPSGGGHDVPEQEGWLSIALYCWQAGHC